MRLASLLPLLAFFILTAYASDAPPTNADIAVPEPRASQSRVDRVFDYFFPILCLAMFVAIALSGLQEAKELLLLLNRTYA